MITDLVPICYVIYMHWKSLSGERADKKKEEPIKQWVSVEDSTNKLESSQKSDSSINNEEDLSAEPDDSQYRPKSIYDLRTEG